MATMARVTSKTEEAAKLRSQVGTLTKEVSEIEGRLQKAQASLSDVQSERNALAIAAADGSPQKSRGIHERIADLEMPVSVLQNRLLEKQSALNQARRTLETLEFEIANEARRAAREARFAELKQQGEQAAARINEKVRSLLTEDLPTLDDVRDSLIREFSGSPSRSLVRELTATLRDGSFLREERRLLRDGWTVRGDIRLDVQNLRAPKK